MAVLKVLFYLIVLILVLVLAYITTRMLGRGMNGRQQSGDMKIPAEVSPDFASVFTEQLKTLVKKDGRQQDGRQKRNGRDL